MNELFLTLVNMSISASWLVLAVLLLRLILKKAPKWINVLLWGIVAIRLICPLSVQSTLSLLPSRQTIPLDIEMDAAPTIDSGIRVVNSVVNQFLSRSNAPELGASINPLQITIAICEGVWILGMLMLAMYAALSYWRLRRQVRTAVRYRDHIYQCDGIGSPFVLGVLRPRIYMPFSMSETEIAAIIAHERSHIQRKGHWWKPLGFLLLTVHWFNPLMWLSYVLLCRDIELACDEKVIRNLDCGQKADYTQALLACSTSRRSIAACPLAFGEVGVKKRVKSILCYKKPALCTVIISVCLCAVLAVCFLTDPKENAYGDIPAGSGLSHAENTGEKRYGLTIGAKGVAYLECTSPYTSGGCMHADESAFKKGEMVWLEALDGITDLRGLTIAAYDKDGNVVFQATVPDGDENQGFTRLTIDGWTLAELP